MRIKSIPEYPGYKVRDDGRVWSDKSHKLLEPRIDKDGYPQVRLRIDGKNIHPHVHRLVAMAYLPNPDNLPCVNHKDENKENNCVDNLEWCDWQYNNTYGTRIEQAHTPEAHAKDQETLCKMCGKPVVQLTLDGVEIARYCSTHEASRQTGLDCRQIARAANGEYRYKTCGGFKWKYV